MRELVNRVHFLMTGVLPENIIGQFTDCTLDGLEDCTVILGWETVENDASKIPHAKYPAIVIDLADGESVTSVDGGEDIGTHERQMRLQIDMVALAKQKRQSIIGDDGILSLWELLRSHLNSSTFRNLDDGTGMYTDALQYPVDVQDGLVTDDVGRIWARARRAILTWRRLELD